MAFKRDIFRGAQFIQGYGVQTTDLDVKEDDRYTSAVRVGHDPDAAPTRAGLQQIISHARSEFNDTHPDKAKLYLERIVATHAGGKSSFAHAYYRPVRNILYDLTPGVIQLPWHRDAAGTDLVYPIAPRQLTIPIYTISFRHRYYQDSCPDLKGAYHGKMNAGNYTFVNLGTFSAKQLLFAPPRATSEIAGETTIWTVEWRFVARADGWIETYYDASNNNAVAVRDTYATASLPGLP